MDDPADAAGRIQHGCEPAPQLFVTDDRADAAGESATEERDEPATEPAQTRRAASKAGTSRTSRGSVGRAAADLRTGHPGRLLDLDGVDSVAAAPELVVLASLVLLLALVAPPLDPAQQARYERALQLYDAGSTVAAAVELESLAVDTGQARMGFEAGQVRFAAGHMAHAWQHFQAYLARRDISEDDRSIAEGRAKKAAAAIRPIHARVTPASAATKIVAVRLGEPPELARPELAAPIRDGVAELHLDPGPWELRVDAPGYQPLHHHLDVIDPGPAIDVPLTLQPVAPPPVVTAPDLGAAKRTDELRRARIDNIVGAVALPVGLAALGGFVASLALRQETRARFESLRREAVACDVRDQLLDLRARASRETGAIIALGITAGAVLTTSAVLLVRGQRRMQRARIALDLRPGQAGLLLSGSF